MTFGLLLFGCAGTAETVTRVPSCAAITARPDEDRSPAEEPAREQADLPAGAREDLGRWFLAYREAEGALAELDRVLNDEGLPEAKKRSQAQRLLERISGVRGRLEKLRTSWAALARQSGKFHAFRDSIREASLDSVFGPRLNQAVSELKMELTRAESERNGCPIDRKLASVESPGAQAWASSPALDEIPRDALLLHAGFSPELAVKLAKEPGGFQRSLTRADGIDALDWVDPSGRSILARIEKLRAVGVTGKVRVRTEQPHALWVAERLLPSGS